MIGNTSQQAVIQNLKDAGCDKKTVAQFLAFGEEGNTQEQLKLLSVQRQQLLDRIHQEEKRIDCLDYLVYQIQRKKAAV